jgi:predicted metal-dependent enzyme (double-stranded beta helix superfamily)
MRSKFEIEAFVHACRGAIKESDGGLGAVRELVAEALSDLPALATALGDPPGAGIVPLHRAPDLTVLDFSWAPWMCLKPHNHRMWSVVGIVWGREDNVFWRRVETTIEAAGARSLGAGDSTCLGIDTIHSVTNPIGRMTRAIHVYGGDFFAPPQPRSEWEHETLVERPWDLDAVKRLFSDAETRARAR